MGWSPRPDLDPWPLSPPLNWLDDPHTDRNWRFQLNAWRPLDVLVTAHSHGDAAMLRPLVELMLDWARFEALHPGELELWNDMGSGLRAAKLAYVLTQSALETVADDQERADLKALARDHLRRLRDRAFIGPSNHGLFQVHGAMALIKALPDLPEADGGEAYVESIFDELLDLQFSSEGVHLEHSPGYQVFVLRTLEKLRASGWYESMTHVSEVIDQARLSLRWFVFPDGTLSRIGDSSAVRTPARWRKRPRGVMGLLYDESGYAFVRTTISEPSETSSMLLVTGGHHSNVHKHADDLSFELFELGRPLIVDTGKYSYSRKAWREYTDSAAAHNAIDLIAERLDNGVRASQPRGSFVKSLSAQPWGWVIGAGFERPEFGVSHERTFLYRPGEWLVLADRIRCEREREMTAWLHLSPEIEAVQDGMSWMLPKGRISYACSAPLTLHRHRGEETPRIQGWIAGGYHHRSPNDALGATFAGTDIRLVTVIAINGDAPPPEVSATDRGVDVTFGDQHLIAEDALPATLRSRRFWRPRQAV